MNGEKQTSYSVSKGDVSCEGLESFVPIDVISATSNAWIAIAIISELFVALKFRMRTIDGDKLLKKLPLSCGRTMKLAGYHGYFVCTKS
jgi:hypothetical protein